MQMLQRGGASPRLAAAGPGPMLSVGSASPSKRESVGLLGGLMGNGRGAAQRAPGAPSQLVTLIVIASLLLNIVIISVLLLRCGGASAVPAADKLGGQQTTVLSTNTVADSNSELAAAHAKEVAMLQESVSKLRSEHAEAIASEKAALARAAEALDERTSLVKQVEQLKAAVAAAGAEGTAVAASTPADCPCMQHSRLGPRDLALQGDRFALASHEFEWKCDDTLTGPGGNQTFCPETARNEQYFQLTFFDRPGAGSKVAVRGKKPVSPKCVQLPPRNYRWPDKYAALPVAPGMDGVHWPNLRVQKLEDLLVFNQGTPKNLYHFNASFYDYEQEGIVAHAAQFIPFAQKVRVMLDIGSGGGSLGLLLKRRYDVQVVSTVFADWPYCEYITERGNLCMYLDAMEAMPFAKFSYDVLHSSWVFHALLESQLRHTYLEQNRILRPGGYMWIKGGWSQSQVDTLEGLLIGELGYTAIFSVKTPVAKPGSTFFDTIPFELEWEAILVKPMRADEKTCRVAQERHALEAPKKKKH